jgi:3',5'-cyclic AMP phosphodiesterase CpdA
MKKLCILFLLLLTGYSISAQDFFFVQITDTHLGYKNHDELSGKIAESVNNLPFDIRAVVVTGDVFQNNLHKAEARESFYRFRSAFNDPLYVLPGNHDLLPDKYMEHRRIFQDEISSLNTIITIDSVAFVLYYSMPHADTSLPDYKTQKSWFENSLENYKNKPMVVFHHQPAMLDFYNNADHQSWPDEELEWWTKVLNTYSVKAVIAGHFHRDELHWLQDVPVYVASSVAEFWGRQASYRIYHYQDGKISYKTVYINE